MNKKILTALVLFLLLVIGGMWVYALLHPSAGNNGLFARFGLGDDAENIPAVTDGVSSGLEDEEVSEEGEVHLHQITTNPVAGAVFAENGMLYVEQGTGHIQYINLVSGEETLISGTTIPGAYEASFSEDGEMVAITTSEKGIAKTIIGAVPSASSTGTLEGVSLPLGATDVSISEKPGVVYYLIKSDEGSRGYGYSISKKTSSELFSVPLRDVHVLWGEPLYVYTTPTYTQTGYIYKVVGTDLQYVTEGGMGLMAFRDKNNAIVTRRIAASNGIDSWFSSLETSSEEMPIGGPVIPEKCVSNENDLWCAIPSTVDLEFPDSWYKGTLSLSDSLWSINTTEGTGSIRSDFLEESGRQIDVLKIGIDPLGTRLYFINKNDNTLWLYEI